MNTSFLFRKSAMVEQVVVNHTRRPRSEFRLTQLQGKYVRRDFFKPQTAIVTVFSSAWLYVVSYKGVEFSPPYLVHCVLKCLGAVAK